MGRIINGVVMEINKNSAIVMTKTGEFVRVKKPSSGITLGEELSARTLNHTINLKYAAIAAAVMIMLIPFTYFRQAMATVAYVNVDINPSLEMGINKYNKVTDVRTLNDDAKKLTRDIGLKGLYIDDALAKVIKTAGDMGYISSNRVNTIEIALIDLERGKVKVTEESLVNYAQSTILKLDVDAKIKVSSAGKKEHDEANDKNISTNKYLDQKDNMPETEVDVKSQHSNDDKESKGSKPANTAKPAKENKAPATSPQSDSQIKQDNNGSNNKNQPAKGGSIIQSGSQQDNGQQNSNADNDSKNKLENNNKNNGGSNDTPNDNSSSDHGSGKK